MQYASFCTNAAIAVAHMRQQRVCKEMLLLIGGRVRQNARFYKAQRHLAVVDVVAVLAVV